ncbi:tripartite tricarboxylate transporter substrate binding protein [Alloyangia pacifica]|uniref:Tripartite-type tricarboxylate transporter, receptor component TctC n=1 Tax=Alloyangia pacifica TaxID=311180 RepID=A0A1I6WCU2_9RHOB|nr:tripartite tricarboxylate transporter substrate binding protein [Alloyangia pacifica]SDI59237.1 Tripartite-type tricarboxylate transporter, receptor component TctC [Alloyangia pacifica]SFT23809.1 Tripartite-type tricarboxylate transporter, receptor component TctC [Alloyangia pacifica]
MIKKTLIGAALATATAGAALAADFPARPIQVVVPYSAGGSTDLSMRVVADAFERLFDGQMVVRNQPGGGGGIGSSAAIHARADGYTLGAGAQGPLVIKPLIGGTDYQLDDVEFIGLYARSLQVMVACADAPFSDYDAFIEYAKSSKPQVGNSGAGGANQISAEAFADTAGISIESVPFNGSSEARTACIGGHIDAMVASPAEAKAASDSGQMTPLFVMEDERIDLFPDTPTAVEKGVDFTWSSWKGLIGPKGMDEETLAWLRDAIQQVANDEEFKKTLTDMGEFVTFEDGEAFEARARKDMETTRGVLEKLEMLGMNN